jgi:uncharacterized protein YkwD
MIRAAFAALFFCTVCGGVLVGQDPSSTLLMKINAIRLAQGLPLVSSDAELTRAAQRHAEEIAARGELSHTGTDGARVGERLDRVGYPYVLAVENLASGTLDADDTLERWLDSPSHRVNLLSAATRQAGVGYIEVPVSDWRIAYRSYWVLVLARPASDPGG